MKKLYCIIYIGIFMLLLAGCQDEGMFTPSEEKGIVTYSIRMDDGLQSRSIGDETIVNNLSILVFDKNKTLVLKKDDLNWNNLKPEDLQFSLLKGEYQVLFWLQYADKNGNTYTINDEGKVSVAYNNNWKGSIEDMKKWDAFYYVDKLEINNDAQTKPITLTRPLGQLNWADSQLVPSTDKHSVVITLSGIATSFDPFLTEESEVQPLTEKDEITFTFNAFTDEPLTTKDGNYYYLSCNYLFPTELTATFELQDKEGNSLKKVGIEEPSTIEIVSNTRTNVLGSIVLKPEAPETNGAWDGITLTEPELEDNCYIIDEPSDLAWLGSKENTLEKACTLKVVKNIDMNCTEETEYSLTSLALPAGSIFMGVADENNVSPYISNIKLTTGGLFGDATNITVQNLNLDNVTATSDSHVGVLVNTLTGSGTFTNVSISNSSATTTDGAAGGMIGYITNKEGETLQVTISACTTTGNAVDGSLASGIYVGRFRGYDNSETLTFSSDNNASSATTTTGKSSYYISDNVAAWLSENDYSKYSGFLGDEEFYRGTVNYGDVRFVPKWDGSTVITPLEDGSTIFINSAFDLASLQNSKPTSVKFKENVDLGSHNFEPIYSIQTLDGEDHIVYNLKVDMVHDGVGAAFIKSVPTGKVDVSHKNLTISGADIKNVHNTTLYPAYAVTNDGGAGNAYGGIFISKANECTSYTIENIHVKDSKLYAVCKMGGVIGQSRDTKLNMSYCTVDNCIIQNYKPNVPNYYVLGNDTQPYMTKSSYYINLLQWWYTNGEVGGLIGFLQDYDADIDNCSVTNTQINCTGEPNKDVVANVYSSKQFDSKNLWKTGKNITAKGKTTIAGRHVNQFIGDVVSYRAEGGSNYTTNITNYTVSGNNYNGILAESTNDNNHKFNNDQYCEVVGCAYYIGLDLKVTGINLGHMKYCAGEVTFSSKNGTQQGSFTEASGDGENIAWIGGNFSLIFSFFPKSEYPSEPTRKDPEY